jgi:hypothetical protein
LVFDIREEHGLRVFENRVLRKIFRPKKLRMFEEGVLKKII